MKKVLLILLAFMFVMTASGYAARGGRTQVNISGVKGDAGVNVEVDYRGEYGMSGRELKFRRGNGPEWFDIPSESTSVTVRASLEDDPHSRDSKHFTSPPRVVDLHIH